MRVSNTATADGPVSADGHVAFHFGWPKRGRSSISHSVGLLIVCDLLTKIALRWLSDRETASGDGNSNLQFSLHKLHFLNLVTQHDSPNGLNAINYLRSLQQSLHATHGKEIQRLLTALLYLPIDRLKTSPYADLLDDQAVHTITEEFMREFCASIGLSRALPLRLVNDLGAGGALLKIEKGRKVLRENRRSWVTTEELPVRDKQTRLLLNPHLAISLDWDCYTTRQPLSFRILLHGIQRAV